MKRGSRVEGLEAAKRALRGLPDDLVAPVHRAMEKSGREIVQNAKILAPTDDGDLRETIAFVIFLKENKFNVVLMVFAGNSPITNSAAWRQEFGRDAGPGAHPGHLAQPFLFPAYWSLRKRARGRIRRAIAKAARAYAARSRARSP